MSEPFIAEIKIFGGNFAIRGFAFCNGQLLPIAQNTALFSLVGTTYGGDGRTTFGLPNLQGRAPVHVGTGPGLSRIREGQLGGAETHTLTQNEMAQHSHAVGVTSTVANTGSPTTGTALAALAATQGNAYGGGEDLEVMRDEVGAGQSHENVQPFLALTFIIALQGTFPSRN